MKSSKYLGVSRHVSGKWTVHAKISEHSNKYLGFFSDEISAARTHDSAVYNYQVLELKKNVTAIRDLLNFPGSIKLSLTHFQPKHLRQYTKRIKQPVTHFQSQDVRHATKRNKKSLSDVKHEAIAQPLKHYSDEPHAHTTEAPYFTKLRSEKKSRFKGVSFCAAAWTDKKWQTRFTYCKTRYYLGSYATEEEAARTYDAAISMILENPLIIQSFLNFPDTLDVSLRDFQYEKTDDPNEPFKLKSKTTTSSSSAASSATARPLKCKRNADSVSSAAAPRTLKRKRKAEPSDDDETSESEFYDESASFANDSESSSSDVEYSHIVHASSSSGNGIQTRASNRLKTYAHLLDDSEEESEVEYEEQDDDSQSHQSFGAKDELESCGSFETIDDHAAATPASTSTSASASASASAPLVDDPVPFTISIYTLAISPLLLFRPSSAASTKKLSDLVTDKDSPLDEDDFFEAWPTLANR